MFNLCMVGNFGISCAQILDGQLVNIVIAGQPGEIRGNPQPTGNCQTDIGRDIIIQIFSGPINRKQGGDGGIRLDKFGCRTGCPGSSINCDKIRSPIKSLSSSMAWYFSFSAISSKILAIYRYPSFLAISAKYEYRLRASDSPATAAFKFSSVLLIKTISLSDNDQSYISSGSVITSSMAGP